MEFALNKQLEHIKKLKGIYRIMPSYDPESHVYVHHSELVTQDFPINLNCNRIFFSKKIRNNENGLN